MFSSALLDVPNQFAADAAVPELRQEGHLHQHDLGRTPVEIEPPGGLVCDQHQLEGGVGEVRPIALILGFELMIEDLLDQFGRPVCTCKVGSRYL